MSLVECNKEGNKEGYNKDMKQKILSAVVVLMSVFAVGSFAMVSAYAQNVDANKDAVCDGIALTGGSCGEEGDGEKTINDTIAQVINILSIVVGVAAVIMIIIGGFRYITSGGDSAGTGAAKNTILYAIIGLVVVAIAQAIVRFVLNQVN